MTTKLSASLTRSLGFNGHILLLMDEPARRLASLQELNQEFCAQRLKVVARDFSEAIGAEILSESISRFEPMGASAAIVVGQQSVLNHLDKSHLALHTYLTLEVCPDVACFRLECEISSCGERDPLDEVNRLIELAEFSTLSIDHRIRGIALSRPAPPALRVPAGYKMVDANHVPGMAGWFLQRTDLAPEVVALTNQLIR